MATDTAQVTKNSITLRGSAKIITEYLEYGVNSILFQRGIYPPESFKPVQNYGLTILMSQDEKIKQFIENVMTQVNDWLSEAKVNKISMIIKNVRSDEVLECWDFMVQNEPGDVTDDIKKKTSDKDLKLIQKEIREVMRQISATVSYLPLLDCICSFDVLIYTLPECEIPNAWSETKPVDINNMQDVALRSFSTGLHKVDTVVHYKMDL